MKTKTLFLLIIVLMIIGLTNCNSESENKEARLNKNTSEQISQNTSTNIMDSEGYKLMVQKCFICHFDKPDPSKKASMIAPPMLRVQEHYKPSYPNKKDFVNAIVTWAKHPSKDKTLMPGTIRKFDLMPKLNYKDEDVKIIAETLYDIDFGKAPKMGMNMKNGLQLNNGKKWKLNKNTADLITSLTNQLEKFRSDELTEYNQLGKDIFDKAKTILLDTTYSENMFNQLHMFFNNIEENIHLLIASKTLNDAKKEHLILINKFNKFSYYFE